MWQCNYNVILQGFRIFNTWLGDPTKVILLEEVVKVIQQQQLLDVVNSTGKHLLDNLKEVEVGIWE